MIDLLVAAAIHFAPTDMCGPSNLPGLSFLNPWVKGCRASLPVPGIPLPQVPLPVSQGTAPAPIPGIGGGGGWFGPQPPTGYAPFP